MRTTFALCILFLSLFCPAAFAQEREISGKVTSSEDGTTLPGITVSVKGTTIGTATAADGSFRLKVPPDAKILVFTSIDMGVKEVEIGASNTIDIQMTPDVKKLKEVVVTALGIKKEKKSIGYSVQDVSGDAISKSGQANVINGISGKVAGAQVINSSGSPGGSTFIRLRGTTSLTGNNQPLIVVDGVPFDNKQEESGNPDNGANNNLVGNVGFSNRGIDINPDDIESVTVLKGPAATALYGLRASNGALVITTKRGAKVPGQKINVTYSSSLTFDQVNKLPEIQQKYAQGSTLYNGTDYKTPKYFGPDAAADPIYGGYVKQVAWGPLIDTLYWDGNASYIYDKNGRIVGKSHPNAKNKVVPYNVADFFQTGVGTDNAIALSGGGDLSTYRFSVGHLNQTGIVPNSTFKRTSIKLSSDALIFSKLKTSGSVTYTKSGGSRIQQGSNVSGLMLGLYRTPPTFDNANGAKDADDPIAYKFADGRQRNYRGGVGYDNPYWTINQNPFNDDVNRVFGFAQAGYDVTKWFNLTYRLGSDFYSDRRKAAYAIYSRAFPAGQVSEDQYFFRSFNSDLFATLNKQFSDQLNGSVMIGHNFYDQYYQKLYVQGDGLNFPDFYQISNTQAIISREMQEKKRTGAFFADAKVDYKNMIFLNVSGRQERSSTLPVDNNTFFYPSASLSFVFTEALKMSSNRYLPFGKLRVSYAQVGNDAPIYATKTYYVGATTGDGWTNGISFPYNGVGGFTKDNALGNPKIKPEKTNSLEIGTELRFFGNKLGLDITYYQLKSIDQILPVPVASSSGYLTAILNSGSVENKGWELALNATPVKAGDFQWDININWSRNRNKVLSLAEGIDNLFIGGFEGTAIRAVAGQPYGLLYGGKWLRNEKGEIIIDDSKTPETNPNYGLPVADTKTGIIGDPNPDWISGITNTITWKGFSLSGLMDIKHGGDMWGGTVAIMNYFGTSKQTENRGETKVFKGVKQSNGAVNDIKVTLDEAWYTTNGGGFGSVSEDFIEDASYVRLREASLSYSFKLEQINRIRLKGLDLALFGKNLLLFTKYSGIDPETSLTGSNNAQGLDYFNMPNARSYGIRLRIML